MGGFDLDKIEGDIELRLSTGNEKFLPLGASELEYTYDGEVVYADKVRILTRRWNYRDCDETKITLSTVNLILFIDGSPDIPFVTIEKALEELKNNLGQLCNGVYKTYIANSEFAEIKIR
jgi:lysyl-tRNA synthetase class 2